MSIKSDVLSYRIPRGYMIVCSSWENDGDHSQTNAVGGLTEESAQLKYDLLNAITDSGCENIYEPCDLELEPLKNAVLEVANKLNILALSTEVKLFFKMSMASFTRKQS